jgi:hypothetical protein
MDEKLKEELLAFFTNIDRTMKAYNIALTSRDYIDPDSHMRNIENINRLCSELKKKVKNS